MFTRISTFQAKSLLATDHCHIFDIRDRIAYQSKHIERAQWLGRENLASICETLNKAEPVLIYCYHGVSSQTVAKILAQQGFTQVYSLDGGFEAWQEENC